MAVLGVNAGASAPEDLDRPGAHRWAGASAAEYASRLSMSHEGGYVWVDSQREIVMSIPMLGALLHSLHRAYGERVPTVLYEMGRTAGRRWAAHDLNAAVDADRPDPAQVFHLASQICGIGGYGELRFVKEGQAADGNHRFVCELYNSAEVEIWTTFGENPGTCCHMPSGFLSGYVSTLLGTDIVFEETLCKAQGFRCCTLIGWPASAKPVAASAAGVAIAGGSSEPDESPDRGEQTSREPFHGIVGNSAGIRAAVRQIRKVAPTKAAVLLVGESGVGKELFARALHERSARSKGPFIALNCGALPDGLIESELFGTERGAYSGADQARPGRFERAHGGTLFLDEVSELSALAQVKLLRAIQEGQIERLGSTSAITVDVRIICASNVDLKQAVEKKLFRLDLYFRLSTITLGIPALRERREDLPLLIEYYFSRYCKQYEKSFPGFTQAAYQALLNYPYPGNVRELSSIIERATILAEEGKWIELSDLASDYSELGKSAIVPNSPYEAPQEASLVNRLSAGSPVPLQRFLASGATLGDIESLAIQAAMDATSGNITKAAELLGISRRQLSYRLKGAT